MQVSSDNPTAVKPVLEKAISQNGSIKPQATSLKLTPELKGESARDLNSTLLSDIRRAEKKTNTAQIDLRRHNERFLITGLKSTKKSE